MKTYKWTIWSEKYKHNGPTEVFEATEADAKLRISAIYSAPHMSFEKSEINRR